MTEEKPKIDDPEEKEFELKVCKAINRMPEEVKDRFKALKVIEDEANAIDEEENEEYRKLELKYEALYQQIYEQRDKVI